MLSEAILELSADTGELKAPSRPLALSPIRRPLHVHKQRIRAEAVVVMSFKVPDIKDNPDSWGPPPDDVPEEYKDVPYHSYGKGDKLGKVADWTQSGYGKFGGSERPSSAF